MTFGFANLSGGGSVEEVLAAAVLDFASSPVKPCDVLTASQRLAFYNHLRNDNGPTNFAMGFRDEAGKPVYKKSAKKTFEEIISWSIATMLGKSKPSREMSFVPYATNANAHSRWAVLDFDAHDGEIGRAYGYTREAYRYLIRKHVVGVVFLVEHTGEGGWHLWLLSPEFHPCAWWIALLEEVAASIGVPIKSGVCEIFPHDEDANNPKRKGVRAPGNWHPGNGKRGELYCVELLPAFVDALIEQKRPSALGLPKEEKGFFLTSPPSEERSPSGEIAPSEKEDSALAEGSEPLSQSKIRARVPVPYKLWQTSWSRRAAIDAPAVRHERLAWLVGQMFYQVGRAMAEQIVKLQFDQRTVITKADWAEHRAEFLELWRGLMARWLATLGQPEHDQLQLLMTESERDVFRILRSFHGWAVKNSSEDFPVAQADLAARLGVSKQYAGQILAHLVTCGILARTAPPVPHKAAARYRWLPPTKPPGVPPHGCTSKLAPFVPAVSVLAMREPTSTPAPAAPPASSSASTIAETAPALPPTQFVELRLLRHLQQVGTLNFDQHRESMQRQGHTPETIAARVPRLQRAADRLVAAQLAYRLDDSSVSWHPPHGPRPPHNVAELIFFSAVKHGYYAYKDISVELRSVRDWPNEMACGAIANKLVTIGLLTPDYRVNEYPEDPAPM